MAHGTIAELEKELNTARETKDPMREVKALCRLGYVCQGNRQLPKAAAFLSRAKKLVDEMEDPRQKAGVYANLGCVYWEMAQLKKAMVLLEEARKLAEQIKDGRVQWGVVILLGMALWRKCEWEAGLDLFQKALEIGKSLADAGENLEDRELVSLREALDRGVMTLQNRIRLGREQNDPLKILQPLFSLIPLCLFTGRKSEAEGLIKEVIPLAEQLGKHDILEVIPKLQKLGDDINQVFER